MERVIDKSIIIVCCIATLFLVPYTTVVIVALLFSLVVSAFQEIRIPQILRKALLVAYLMSALLLPGFVMFLPLIAYDCFRVEFWPLRVGWLLPLVVGMREFSAEPLAFSAVLVMVACLLAWRTNHVMAERGEYLRLRDEMRELSLSLEQKNRGLEEKQDYEVKLATLDERARIAREIHDNVGHLLTRSVLQIEALQVVHAREPQVKEELEQVGTTIHEAFDTVRESVHNLHDDSFDLHTQLFAITKESQTLDIKLDYQVEAIPQNIGYSLLAIVREALANAAKHSDASKVKLSVTEYPAFWQLILHDNGTKNPLNIEGNPFQKASLGGRIFEFDTLLSATSTGIGLRTMAERIRSIGGLLRIDYDSGLRIFISVPKADQD